MAGMLIVPHLTWQTRASTAIFLFLLFTTLPLLLFLPLRLTAFLAGVGPFLITHPFMRRSYLLPMAGCSNLNQLQRILNEVSLSEKHIEAKGQSSFDEIEVFQNERWARPSSSATSAANGNVIRGRVEIRGLEPETDRTHAWTREPDGSQAVGDDSSHLKIHLEPGWEYVETEDWAPDYLGRWLLPEPMEVYGWVYTNDAWLNPHATPLEEWQKPGMTRRRRWTRRIYRTHVI
ncbi:hypothetical protein BS47DRAFT_1352351 [Hydnum rufescens UP504]|uniref:Peroxin domain-containing protein n=1 Tax=Hydnum rufescens UP504 TaxID=1448309 RepID=A0A9P6DQ07_9AGAM|nr:hypothetical protein BS47DRAFT_1352351 [Hydnum rufescens UP504]